MPSTIKKSKKRLIEAPVMRRHRENKDGDRPVVCIDSAQPMTMMAMDKARQGSTTAPQAAGSSRAFMPMLHTRALKRQKGATFVSTRMTKFSVKICRCPSPLVSTQG
jgi:hypothetical protein